MKFFFFVASAILAVSCHRENLKYDKAYFDFDSLVHAQVQQLASRRGVLIKKTFLNGKIDSTTLTPDTTQWKRELDAFQQLDVINKPLFKGKYQSEDEEDNHSNLLVCLLYTSPSPRDGLLSRMPSSA